MGEPFNVKARNAALDLWNESTGLDGAFRIEGLLSDGDTDDIPEIRRRLYALLDFAENMLDATMALPVREDS